MTRTFASQEDFAVWDLERQTLEQQIGAFERHARSTLKSLRCPVDPAGVYAMLAGEKPFPGRARERARDRQRALHAMHLLVALRDVRAHLGPTRENATKAAYAALRAGFLSNAIDAAFGAEKRAKKRDDGRKGGNSKASRLKARQTTVDRFILKHATAFRDSGADYIDPKTGKEYLSAAAYVRAKDPKLSLDSIRARLKALKFKP
jgi:hypothetical protein